MAYDSRLLAGVSVFMAVVEAGTFARAAEGLGLTPSGVSRAIARLEARVGVRLLDRTTRSMSLTDEGRRFRERVAPLLGGIEAAALEAAGARSVVRGRLRVNVDPFFARLILAHRLETFLAHHPEVQLELIMRDHVGDLIADGFDVAVRFGEPPAGAFTTRKLVETSVLTVAAPAYLAVWGRPITPADIPDHHCIQFYDAANGRPFEWEFRRDGETVAVTPNPRLLVSDVGTMLSACAAGAGMAQVLGLSVGRLIDDGALEPVLIDWADERFALYALYPAHRHRAAKVVAFTDFCLDTLAEQAAAARPDAAS